MALGDEVVVAGEPEEQEESEEEEEEELVDPQTVLREECSAKPKCAEFKEILDKCNERVAVKPAIEEETCEEELIDYVNCVDHCVAKSLFSKLA
ncbi:cytochrome b-c1 complex subunit 6, mitochondrial-like [Saccostrea echinata]|uniref:cytochrome b-c1 complex subunit 6, mitochondrial-like n=1 Tax=Saccostrea echinata TaxID=191078 RepID=UPI002A816678|nr:cytochrome b-c1 complex subunit 6, mitochondrial-like [Saccostrea echinata]